MNYVIVEDTSVLSEFTAVGSSSLRLRWVIGDRNAIEAMEKSSECLWVSGYLVLPKNQVVRFIKFKTAFLRFFNAL